MPARPANPLFGRSRFGYKIAMVGFSLPTQLAICLFHRDKMSLGPIRLLFLWFRFCLNFSCANHHGRMDLAFLGGTLLNRLTPLPLPFWPHCFFVFVYVGNSFILPIFRNCKCHLVDTLSFSPVILLCQCRPVGGHFLSPLSPDFKIRTFVSPLVLPRDCDASEGNIGFVFLDILASVPRL